MSVASTVFTQTCHVCEYIKNSIIQFYYKSQRNKQLSANQRIYEIYMGMDSDKDFHLNKMNDKTIMEYEDKINRLWNKPKLYDGL